MKSLRLNRVSRAHDDESGVALITALLAILVTAMFAIVMLGLLLSQVMPTKLEQATTRTVFAAEAGINAAVGQLRNVPGSSDAAGNVYGDKSKLPCEVVGKVNSDGSDVGYDVTIRYYTENPTGQTDAWRNDPAHKLTCTTGYGPTKIPTHALITSTGAGLTVANSLGDVSRKIEAVYAFTVTSTNIPGGLVYSWDKATKRETLCLEATDMHAGANVKYVDASTCGSNNSLQLWVYTAQYRIQLAVTTVPSFGLDALCVTGNPNGSTAVKVTLELCAPNASPTRWNQLWSWSGSATWQAENPAVSDYANFWLTTGSTSVPSSGRYLSVWNKDPGASPYDSPDWGSFDPQAAVGPGAASHDTQQMVNSLEFGRCADVTHANFTILTEIDYPCKQDPSGGSHLAWNHKWKYEEPADLLGDHAPQLIVVSDGTNHCLRSTGSPGGSVYFSTACTAGDQHFQWTRTAKTGDYETSFTFKDGWGRCLDLDTSHLYESWSTLVTNDCVRGQRGQQWNAPSLPSPGGLDGYWELN